MTATAASCPSCQTPLPVEARFCLSCGIDVTGGATVVSARRSPLDELETRLSTTLSGRYHVRKLLGAGGMGAVFLAEEVGLERPVAIKVLPPELSRDEGVVARFQREARTAAKLDHPHIIPIHRVESENGLHYFTMKYVPGRALESVLASGQRLELPEIVRILGEAAAALGHAHARGVVHRDVKPANIMLDESGRVVLTDFGISKAGESTMLTQTGTIVGTPHYMAPEQVLGREVDGRADQYALGVVAYEMVTGRRPFEGESMHTILYQHVHEPPPPLPSLRGDVPADIAEAIGRALAKDPADRFATMEDFARALRGDAAAPRSSLSAATTKLTVPTPSRAPTVMLRPEPSRRARRAAIAAAVIGTLVTAAGASWVLAGPADEAPSTVAETSMAAQPIADSTSPAVVAPGTATASMSDTPPQPVAEPPRSTQHAPRVRETLSRRNDARPAETPSRPTASLNVDADPYGTVFVDGVEIGDTPVVTQLEVGRTIEIRVVRDGYVTKIERIPVRGPNPIRRRYALEPIGGTP